MQSKFSTLLPNLTISANYKPCELYIFYALLMIVRHSSQAAHLPMYPRLLAAGLARHGNTFLMCVHCGVAESLANSNSQPQQVLH